MALSGASSATPTYTDREMQETLNELSDLMQYDQEMKQSKYEDLEDDEEEADEIAFAEMKARFAKDSHLRDD
jgi:hypothetical protein